MEELAKVVRNLESQIHSSKSAIEALAQTKLDQCKLFDLENLLHSTVSELNKKQEE